MLEQRLPEITKASVLFTRWIAKAGNLEAVTKNSELLKEHIFYLQEKINDSKYLLSNKEEILAAKLKNTGWKPKNKEIEAYMRYLCRL